MSGTLFTRATKSPDAIEKYGAIVVSCIIIGGWVILGTLAALGKAHDNQFLRDYFVANTAFTGIALNYWVGSSTGSKKKDDTIAAQSDQLAASAPPTIPVIPVLQPPGGTVTTTVKQDPPAPKPAAPPLPPTP